LIFGIDSAITQLTSLSFFLDS